VNRPPKGGLIFHDERHALLSIERGHQESQVEIHLALSENDTFQEVEFAE
jgi:hypothetical protein